MWEVAIASAIYTALVLFVFAVRRRIKVYNIKKDQDNGR